MLAGVHCVREVLLSSEVFMGVYRCFGLVVYEYIRVFSLSVRLSVSLSVCLSVFLSCFPRLS